MINANDPSLRSWIDVPAGSDFPIQNIPFGMFEYEDYITAGTAIGDYVIDLAYLQGKGHLDGLGLPPNIFRRADLNDFLALGRPVIRATRDRISELFRHDNPALQSDHVLIPREDVQMLMPVRIGNYTDFYSSEEHATNVGSMFRDPKNALLPNWKHLPVGYHGRASSIVISGTSFHRPKGQVKPPDAEQPVFTPTRKLDFELEVAFITCGKTNLGDTISTNEAEDHIAGFVLFNDWSARDIQQWEYVPLGPFLAKNFASTISPWIVTLDALEPFRVNGPEQSPAVLSYLTFTGARNFDIRLDVQIQPATAEAVTVCRSNFKYMYWNVCQQLAHHTVNGCNIQTGDLYASGTISGPSPGSYGSLLELSWNGQKPLPMADNTERTFLADGDAVIIRGYAEKDGVRIGFGECSGQVLPAR